MEPHSEESDRIRLNNAIPRLNQHGFSQFNGRMFSKGHRVYDLSAADIDQIERVERDGLFVCGELEFIKNVD